MIAPFGRTRLFRFAGMANGGGCLQTVHIMVINLPAAKSSKIGVLAAHALGSLSCPYLMQFGVLTS